LTPCSFTFLAHLGGSPEGEDFQCGGGRGVKAKAFDCRARGGVFSWVDFGTGFRDWQALYLRALKNSPESCRLWNTGGGYFCAIPLRCGVIEGLCWPAAIFQVCDFSQELASS
jgi:hypothetical protein